MDGWNKHCERVEGRCGGRWTFKGSRVEPRHVRARFLAGDGLVALCEDHPHIPAPAIQWAVSDTAWSGQAPDT
jgi:uncharacterized protein (DUF433 family)